MNAASGGGMRQGLAVVLAILVLGSVIPLAGYRLWISLPLSLAAAALCLLAAVAGLSTGGRDATFRRDYGALVPIALGLLVWFWLQTVWFLPPVFWNPFFHLGGLDAGAISVHPEISLQFVLRMCAYMMVFWVTTRVAGDHRVAQGLLVAAALSCACLAVFAIQEQQAGSLEIFGYEKRAGIAATGTFESPNSYANYAVMGFACAIAVLLAPLSGGGGDSVGRANRRIALVLRVLMAVCAAACAVSVWLSDSRAGLVLLPIAPVLLLAGVMGPKRWRALVPAGMVVAAILGAVVLIVVGSVFSENAVIAGLLGNRADQLRAAWEVAALHGPAGAGLGGFPDGAAARKPPELVDYNWDAAHNTFVEHVIEMGWIAAPVFWALLLLLAGRLVLGLADRRRDRHFAALGLAVFVVQIVHGAVDYPLHRPASALLFVMLLGIGWTQSWASAKPGRGRAGRGADDPAPTIRDA